jgi:hypothetical protein
MLMSLKLVGEIDFQVAAWVSYMFYNFYLMKNHKIAHNSTTTTARKTKHKFGILKILEIFEIYFTYFKNSQILLSKISQTFLVTTKLFTGWNDPIRMMGTVLYFCNTKNINLLIDSGLFILYICAFA